MCQIEGVIFFLSEIRSISYFYRHVDDSNWKTILLKVHNQFPDIKYRIHKKNTVCFMCAFFEIDKMIQCFPLF